MIFLGKTFAGATFKKGENIDQFLLEYCNKTLTEVVTPTDCNVRNYFFREQTNLQKITFGDGCTKLDYGVCQNCTSLHEVYIPNSVTTIESDAFYGCGSIHFIIDAETSSISGYPWGATDCTVEWLRGGDAPVGDFIFYNDSTTLDTNGFNCYCFAFHPFDAACENPESLDLLNNRRVKAVEIMSGMNPSEYYQPVYIRIQPYNTDQMIASSINSEIIGGHNEFVHFELNNPIDMNSFNGQLCEIKFVEYPGSNVGKHQCISFHNNQGSGGCTELYAYGMDYQKMATFKLIFE